MMSLTNLACERN